MSEVSKAIFSTLKVGLTSPCHAYYSAEAARLYGVGIWANAEGREVAVTCVDPDGASLDEGYLWEDRVYVGIMMRRLRNGPCGERELPPFVYSPYLPE